MKKKQTLYIVIIISLIIGVIIYTSANWQDFKKGFMAGYNSGQKK